MTFDELDQARIEAGITQQELCRKARIHPVTYSRRVKNPDQGLQRTLARLWRALESLKAEREGA